MYVFMTTTIAGELVSAELIDEERAVQILNNLHITRVAETGLTLIVETSGGAFRRFFDRVAY